MVEKRKRFPVAIACPKCKQKGTAIWEEAVLPNPQGLAPELIILPEGFFHRVRKNVSTVPEIACHKCGAPVPD
jgi:hypothetical protein